MKRITKPNAVRQGDLALAKIRKRNAFAAKVRAARAILGWSQTQLAKRVGLTQRAIYKIEHAAVAVRKSTAAVIDGLFDQLGLEYKSLPDGGFTIRVPRRILDDGNGRPVRRKK